MTFAFSPAPLLTFALLCLLLSGGIGWLFSGTARFSAAIFSSGGLLASLATIAAALPILTGASSTAALPPFSFLAVFSPLNGLLLLAVSLPALFCSLYAWVWLRSVGRPVRARAGFLCNLLLATLITAVLAVNAVQLLLSMELAALCAGLLIVQNDEVKSRRAGLNQFLSGRVGTLCLVLAFSLLYHTSGSLDFDVIRHSEFSASVRSAAFLLSLTGFGLYAGLIPLHGWVPQSHTSAPAHAAALFSSALMKVGILGVIKIGLDLLGTPPLWWGVLVMLLAMLTAFIGGLYALMEHDIRRLLAYHTLENVGIILLGVGGAMIGVSLRLPLLATLALLAALFHLFNHGLFKTTLFLGAGEIERQTGIKDIERLGGLARLMPWTAGAMLIALMAMAALPPLNGFASEWLLYQSFFQLGTTSFWLTRLLGPLLAVGLALTGALALMCIAKVFGVTFLGSPRSAAAARATSAPLAVRLSIVLPALLCVVFGVASPWIVPLFSLVATDVLQMTPLIITQHDALAPAASSVSVPMVTILLLAMPLLPWLIAVALRGSRLPNRQRGDAWACGYGHSASMVVTATGFAQPLRVMFAPLYLLRQRLLPTALVTALHQGRLAALCRRLAFIELAVLLVAALA
ncbi:proton-conducting transporter membrane subunit [Erwinia sp.]|uniref:proton-conducting transporter transmembrane domain-containing protein n=1 Tax=Erwinia citreus TaxID=558 RepID=UPI0028A24F40|nr:proton-conducting transporter membrane subunit [Erwinia sp.]